MPRLIALEWDAHEARVAVARTRGKEMTLEQAFAVELSPRDTGQTLADTKVGERIAAALGGRNIGRTETLVAVGRANIELRQLTIPTAPPEELPEMVRFQALRQFTTISDDWPLDFVQLDAGQAESLTVLAAAISPEMVAQIQRTCRAGDLTATRLVLRPFAAASLLRRQMRGDQQPPRLMVDLLADEADLTVLVEDHVALMRTVRLTAREDGAQAKALLGQIRRTIAAAQNQMQGRRIEKVILCGDGSDQATLKRTIENELSFEVEVFDPLAGLRLGRELQQVRPEHTGRFAPLVGMLLDEATGQAHAIDFLHPRRKPQPPSRRRRNVLFGATAAVAMLAAVFLIWTQLSSMDAQIETLRSEANRLTSKVEEAEQMRRDVAAVEEFLESDIAWLDELDQLARRLPSAEEMIVTQISLGTRSPAGGQVVLDGYVRRSEQIRQVQQALRMDGREVLSTGGQEEPRRDDYRWRFKETVLIDPGETGSTAGETQGEERELAEKMADTTTQGEAAAR